MNSLKYKGGLIDYYELNNKRFQEKRIELMYLAKQLDELMKNGNHKIET